jgi:hypothetical protein
VREEIGMAVSYLAERLCYRVSFPLGGICKRCLLAAGDYWRAKGERLGHVRRGLREDNWGISNAGKSHRTAVRKPASREGQGASDLLTPLALSAPHSPIRSECSHWRCSPWKPRLWATGNVEMTHRSICLPDFPARAYADRYSRREAECSAARTRYPSCKGPLSGCKL